MKQNAKYIIIAVALVIVVYPGFDLLKLHLYPCEGIFQQTITQIGGNLETIQTNGGLFIGAAQILELTERSQMISLNLKTCCTLTNQGILPSEEFLSCKGNADAYVQKFAAIAQWLKKWATDEHAWDHNLIALGGFNIDRTDDPLYRAFTSTGLRTPDDLNAMP